MSKRKFQALYLGAIFLVLLIMAAIARGPAAFAADLASAPPCAAWTAQALAGPNRSAMEHAWYCEEALWHKGSVSLERALELNAQQDVVYTFEYVGSTPYFTNAGNLILAPTAGTYSFFVFTGPDAITHWWVISTNSDGLVVSIE